MIFASQDASPIVSWDEILLRRYQDILYLDRKEYLDLPSCIEWTNFPSPLILDRIQYPFASQSIKSWFISTSRCSSWLLNLGRVGSVLSGMDKQKLKKLLQEWDVPPWRRETDPFDLHQRSARSCSGLCR